MTCACFMFTRRQPSPLIGLAAALVLAATPAWCGEAAATASDRWSGSVILGAAAIPDYEGAASLRAFPLIAGQLRHGNRYAEVQGTSLRVNLVDSARLALGPAASFTFGRGKNAPASVQALGRIGDAFEVGGFAAVAFPGLITRGDELRVTVQVTTDVSGRHDGVVGEVSASWRVPLGSRLMLGLDLRNGFASNRFARRYFSVGPSEALASGLPEFAAAGGARDVGSGISLAFAIDRRWSLVGFASHRRLLGDFAASPVVRLAGDRHQFIVGAGIGFSF